MHFSTVRHVVKFHRDHIDSHFICVQLVILIASRRAGNAILVFLNRMSILKAVLGSRGPEEAGADPPCTPPGPSPRYQHPC